MERVLYLRGSTRAPHGAELHQSRDAGPQAVSAERSRDGLWGQPTTYHRNRDPFSRGRAEVSGDIHPSSLSLGKVALRLSVSSAQPPRPTPTAKLATPLREIEGESMETLGGYMGLKYLIKFPRDWSHHFLLSHSLLLGSSANSRENENKDFQPNKNLCSNPPTPRACH